MKTVTDDLDPASRTVNGPGRPKKHLRRPGGGRAREELNPAISTNKPEENATLRSVNVEGTDPEHATLLAVRGGIRVRRDGSFDSSVELLIDCGARSHFMSNPHCKEGATSPLQTDKRWTRLNSRRRPSRGAILHESLSSSWRTRVSTSLQGIGNSAACGTSATMVSKL